MRFLLLIGIVLGFAMVTHAKQYPTALEGISWNSWLSQLREQALSQNIPARLFDDLFDGMKPSHHVKALDKKQPEKRLTFLQYRQSRIDPYRISLGKKEMKKHEALLSNIAKEYGVNRCVIAALWGIETSYGRFTGNFPVIHSLASLAYEGRRGAFFRNELLRALHIVNDGHISPEDYKGEWAGGSGQTQFLPSSWHHYAVDQNGDGKKDIWQTHGDIFASVANYLVKNDWHSQMPIAMQVSLPPDFDRDLLGLKTHKTVREWEALGVRAVHAAALPLKNVLASIVYPEGGPSYIAYPNFDVLLRWNRSTYFVLSVDYLAGKMCQSV